jgi:hypothetical protein
MSRKRSNPSSKPLRIVVVAGAALLLPATAEPGTRAADRFEADLMPLNASVGGGASGTVKLAVNDDSLTIEADVKGLSPGMHMIHIHGFTTGDKAAACAGPAQDTNHDGIIDLAETEPVSGTTLIPFHDQPATLKLASDKYPVAGSGGSFRYGETVPLKALDAALKKQFGIENLNLGERVVYVHGVPDGSKLPATVKSLPGVPASMTLPVACGVIREVH